MENKRRQSREYLSSEARIRRPGGGDVMDAVVLNITSYGIGIYTDIPLKTDEQISVSIILNRQGRVIHSEEVPAIVRWVERIKKIYSVGISFDTKINEKEFPIFFKCLEYTRIRR